MCRLLGYAGPEPIDLMHPVLQAPNAMIAQSRRDTESGKPNDAGWGYGLWNNAIPSVIKQPTKPAEDPDFSVPAQTSCKRLILHIRRASAGRVAMENTHPFQFVNQLIFAHNGSIDKFDTIRDYAIQLLPVEHRNVIKGATDSEFIMHLFLSELYRLDTPDTARITSFRKALQSTIHQCRQLAEKARGDDPPELNFMFLTKHFLISTKVLYWLGFYPSYRGGTLITSEPLETDDGWQPLEENTMIVARRDGRYEILNLEL
jgi:glutamine amidotransferase